MQYLCNLKFIMVAFMSRLFLSRVKHLAFKKYLWVTNTVSCGVLLGVGDVIQQSLERYQGKSKSKFDWDRTERMTIVGLSQGPPHHIWYTWLDRVLPGRDVRTIGRKILMDQIFAAPFFAVTFFMGMSYLEYGNLFHGFNEFSKKFPTLYAFDWIIWPPTQYINFFWIPGPYRVLYINGITVIWDVFLSYLKHYDHLEKEKPVPSPSSRLRQVLKSLV